MRKNNYLPEIFTACVFLLGLFLLQACSAGSGIFQGYPGKKKPDSEVGIVTSCNELQDGTSYNIGTVNGKKLKYFYRGRCDRIAMPAGINKITASRYRVLSSTLSGSTATSTYGVLSTEEFTLEVTAGQRYILTGWPLRLIKDTTASPGKQK